MLFVYQFLAYIAFVVFTNWPMNVLGSTIIEKFFYFYKSLVELCTRIKRFC